MFDPKGPSILDEQLAVSGLEMNIWNFVIPAVATIGASVIGSNASRSASKDAQRVQEENANRQYEYDLQKYELQRQGLIAQREESIQRIDVDRLNEKRVADFKDANARESFNYSMRIRNYQQDSMNRQYMKSEDLFNEQVSYNARSATSAKETQLRVLSEEAQKFAFENENQIIENLVKEGQARARGVTGRSSRKVAQAQLAALGRNQAVMEESMVSARRNIKAQLEEIQRQHFAADMGAYAKRMLNPGELPLPVAPFATPLAEYKYPRELQDYDFGPEPIRGAVSTYTPSWTSSFAQYLPGIAQSVQPLLNQMFTPQTFNYGTTQFGAGGGNVGGVGTLGPNYGIPQ